MLVPHRQHTMHCILHTLTWTYTALHVGCPTVSSALSMWLTEKTHCIMCKMLTWTHTAPHASGSIVSSALVYASQRMDSIPLMAILAAELLLDLSPYFTDSTETAGNMVTSVHATHTLIGPFPVDWLYVWHGSLHNHPHYHNFNHLSPPPD